MSATGAKRKRLSGIFFLDTTLGLETQARAWMEDFPTEFDVDPRFVLLGEKGASTWLNRWPLLPKRLRRRLQPRLAIRQSLRDYRADFVFTLGAGLTLVRQFSCPVFGQLDATPIQLQRFGAHYGYHRSFAPLEALKHRTRTQAFARAKTLFPTSHWCRQSLIDDYHVLPENLQVLPFGIHASRYQPTSDSIRRERKNCRLIFVGGSFSRKGGHQLLAWAQQTTRRDWHLDLVTKDPPPIHHPAVTVHTGLTQEDPKYRELLQSSDILLLPTLADCSPLVVLEAAAAGVCSVMFDIGGARDLIQHDDTGLIIPAHDFNGFFQATEALIQATERRLALGVAARRNLERHFDFTLVRKRVISQIIEKLRIETGPI